MGRSRALTFQRPAFCSRKFVVAGALGPVASDCWPNQFAMMKPTDKHEVRDGILIGVAIALATALFHGAVDEVRYRWSLKRKKKVKK